MQEELEELANLSRVLHRCHFFKETELQANLFLRLQLLLLLLVLVHRLATVPIPRPLDRAGDSTDLASMDRQDWELQDRRSRHTHSMLNRRIRLILLLKQLKPLLRPLSRLGNYKLSNSSRFSSSNSSIYINSSIMEDHHLPRA